MAQGLRKKAPKKVKNKPLTKRQRTAGPKKTARRRNVDAVTKKVNADIEKRTGGVAARAGQHFELAAVSESSQKACAEQRAAAGTSKKQRREAKAKEKALAVAKRVEEERGPTWMG
mmetsp:Transcript_1220/g.3671  ORF Transcript_1220/g.3671 Transcript_1220/m.3671 type:complete len:116 (-) Transcript_1220:24-371(-)